GLWLGTAIGADGRADTLILSDGPRVLWGERRRHDTRGRVVHRSTFLAHDPDRRAAGAMPAAWRHQALADDDRDRLIGIQDGAVRTWLAWDEDGHLRARRDQPAPGAAGAAGAPDAGPAILRGVAGPPLASRERR